VPDERAGGTLGEVPLFDGGGYPATAIAAEPTRCAIIDRAVLAAAMHQDPEMAWTLLARLAARVRTLVARLGTFASDDVSTRLAALIVARLDAAPRAGSFTLGGTQHAIAEELGTVREVVVKSLRRLREAGVIRASGRGRWIVADERALRARARGDG
jgi:CRP/FNR family transcriptional regulator